MECYRLSEKAEGHIFYSPPRGERERAVCGARGDDRQTEQSRESGRMGGRKEVSVASERERRNFIEIPQKSYSAAAAASHSFLPPSSHPKRGFWNGAREFCLVNTGISW